MIRRVVWRQGNPTPVRSLVTTISVCPKRYGGTTPTPSPSPADHFALPPRLTNSNPSEPVEVLDVVLHTVSKRYGIPTNATDMRHGTVAAYRALGIVLQQYVNFLDKEGPSSFNARMATFTKPLPTVSGTSSSSSPRSAEPTKDEARSSAHETQQLAEEIRKASFTSLVSFLVRTLFSKHTTPMETPSIAEAINKRAALNRKRRQEEFLSALEGKKSDTKTPEADGTAKKAIDGVATTSATAANISEDDDPENATNIIDAMNKGVGSKGQAIVERHFPMTSNFRNLLSNLYHMPTHKMVPVLGAAGKGLGKEFRDYFVGSGRVTLRFGKFTAGLYPGPLPSAGPNVSFNGEICTPPELTNVFELSHPADHVLRASIKTIRVDGTVIEAASDDFVIPSLTMMGIGGPSNGSANPTAIDLLESQNAVKEFVETVEHDVNVALGALDKHRPPKPVDMGAAASHFKDVAEQAKKEGRPVGVLKRPNPDGTIATVTLEDLAKEMEKAFSEENGDKPRLTSYVGPDGSSSSKKKKGSTTTIELESFPHVSVDVLLQVVVPPRRFVSDYDFYEERVHGPDTEGERLSIAKLLALHSATSITRFGDAVYRMFSGKPLRILTPGNKTIEMLAKQVGAEETVGPTATSTMTTMDGSVVQRYPFEAKIMTMVYCFKDREWAIDNIQTIM